MNSPTNKLATLSLVCLVILPKSRAAATTQGFRL